MALITCPECSKKVSESVDTCIHCGYKFTIEEKLKIKKNDSQSKVIATVIVTVLMILLFRWCSNVIEDTDSNNKNTTWEQIDNSVEAWTYVQMAVENNLKSPSTAKFPWGYSDYVTRQGTTYHINAYVDSQNSFGAMIRTNFKATVQQVDKDNWKLIALKFDN